MRNLGYLAALLAMLCVSPAWAQTDGASYDTASFGGCDSGCDSACGCETDCCDSSCCDCDRWFLLPQCDCGFNIHGWLNVGYIYNTDDPASQYNGPYNAVDRANEFAANQAYLIGEKALPGCGIGIGGRVDVMWGQDFFLAESIGMEKRPDGSPHWNGEYYGLAIPQAYFTFGNENFNLQAGHFYSIIGYEGVMAPSNFFYSKAYSYQFAGPFTHWGAQLNYSPNDCWDLQVGIHNGWDAVDRTNDRVGLVAKATYHFCRPGAWTSFGVTTGDEANNPGAINIPNLTTNRTRYSWIVNLPVGCNWEYVFHHWYGQQDEGAARLFTADWYGVDQYLYYTINDCWKAGARFEWFRDEDGTRVGLNRATNPNDVPFAGDFFSLTFGLNWTPTCNVTIRPEVRVDWYDGNAATLPYDDGADDQQVMFGIDGIFLF